MFFIRENLGIDLGTASTLVYVRGKGVVLNEPSVIAYDSFSDEILAVGTEAQKMLGRTPGHIMAKTPMADGVIADFKATEAMLRYFINKSIGRSLFGINLMICVPSKINQVQKRAVLQAAKMAGANKVYLIEEPIAVAIGESVDITDPRGALIIDIGGGTTDVALISMGGMVVSESLAIAGDECDEAIAQYIKNEHQIMIGERTAENIKIKISRAMPKDIVEEMEVKGLHLLNGLPEMIKINSNDIAEALEKPLKEILDAVHRVLENSPPELASDLYDRGAILTGGGSMIKDLDKLIEESIGIKVRRAENPLTSVARGTGRALQWIETLSPNDTKTFGVQKKVSKRRNKNV